jgi:hypothetical protein
VKEGFESLSLDAEEFLLVYQLLLRGILYFHEIIVINISINFHKN